jgi:hypothetical protein
VVDVPIAGVADVPIAGVVDVPIVESVVPIGDDDAVPDVSESVVEADPIKDVRAGSVAAAEAPIPNLAAKELKSVTVCKPRVARKASKSGSDAVAVMGVTVVGTVSALVLVAVDVIGTVPKLPKPEVGDDGEVGEVNVEVCACASHGVAMSAKGAIHSMILCMSPPCSKRCIL